MLLASAGAGALVLLRRRPAVQGLRRGGAVRRDPTGRRTRRDRPPPRRVGRRPQSHDVPARALADGRRPTTAGGGVSVRSSRQRATGDREDRARRSLRSADHVSRRPDDQTDGAPCTNRADSERLEAFVKAAQNAALVSALDPAGARSRRLPLSRHLHAAAEGNRRSARGADGRRNSRRR